MKRSSCSTFGTCGVHLGVCLALLANLLLPAFSAATPHQRPAPSTPKPQPDPGPFIQRPKTSEPKLSPEPPAPKGTGMTLLDRVGMPKQRLDPQQVAAWRRELEAPATSSNRKFQLRLWLAEARMRVDLEPDQARAEVESLLDDLPASSPLRGVATLDLGITQFATGRYRLAARTLADLLDTKIAGYDRNGAALLAKHANACAGYHEERRKAGITEPSHIDPLCGASGLAIALRYLGRPHRKAELAAKTPHTGFGSNLQDLIVGAKNLGLRGYPIAMDQDGLKTFFKLNEGVPVVICRRARDRRTSPAAMPRTPSLAPSNTTSRPS